MSRKPKLINSPWDKLSSYFDTHLDLHNIEPDAAVNIHIGWPVFFNQVDIQTKFLDKKSLDILDFGCGTGSLCLHLNQQGHNVTGVDASQEMLNKAKVNLPASIKLVNADHKSKIFNKELKEQFDLITSMHVLDWIKEIKPALTNLSNALREGGLLLFSVFPEDHIIDQLRIQDLFEDFDSNVRPRKGVANFNGVKVPVFVKKAAYYDKLASSLGLTKVLEYYPPYPATFLKNYKWTGSLCPEMLILAYRKNSIKG
jgi:SAM-dependent methyltransferase